MNVQTCVLGNNFGTEGQNYCYNKNKLLPVTIKLGWPYKIAGVIMTNDVIKSWLLLICYSF